MTFTFSQQLFHNDTNIPILFINYIKRINKKMLKLYIPKKWVSMSVCHI